MSEILQKQGAQLTTEQLLQIMAEERRQSDARLEAFLGTSFSYRLETSSEPESSVFLGTFPTEILPGTQLPVEILDEVDSPISDSSEDVTVEATGAPALEPGFHPFGVQVAEEFVHIANAEGWQWT